MRVLVATNATQGQRDNDYCWTVEGELVRLPMDVCANPKCGCAWGFAGLTSSRATSTARVGELDLDRSGLRTAFLDALRREKWVAPAEDPDWLDEYVDFHLAVAGVRAVGTVVEIHGDEIRERRVAA